MTTLRNCALRLDVAVAAATDRWWCVSTVVVAGDDNTVLGRPFVSVFMVMMFAVREAFDCDCGRMMLNLQCKKDI